MPGLSQAPPARRSPDGVTVIAARDDSPQDFPGADEAIEPGAASFDQPGTCCDAVADGARSIVPLPSSANCCPLANATARESATSASPASTRPGAHVLPSSLVVASGEKTRLWLGRMPTTSGPPSAAAMTRPPLSATPGGVTSVHLADPAGRVNSCQKLSSLAAEPPITRIPQVAAAVDTEVASEGVTACPIAALPELLFPPPDPVPHPAAAIAATARARSAALFMTFQGAGARRSPAARRTRTRRPRSPGRDRSRVPAGSVPTG